MAEFLDAAGPILDARSPGEYCRGHIPGAISFPLFDDGERAQVGTCYKHQGRDRAVELGLDLVGPKLGHLARSAKSLACEGSVRLHCWRGGMRSGSLAWLLETAGLKVTLLEGGYKAFRRWVRETLSVPKLILTLGGMTGTGKTEILLALQHCGEQAIDLEALACHRGSSFGALGQPPQPTTEHFENLLARDWSVLDPRRRIWIEAESRGIGTCRVPPELFQPMQAAPVLEVVRPRQERIAFLEQVYGGADRTDLIAATERLHKRLGGDRARRATAAIRQGDLAAAIAIILDYYDKAYRYDLNRRQVPIHSVHIGNLTAMESAQKLMACADELGSAEHLGSGDDSCNPRGDCQC